MNRVLTHLGTELMLQMAACTVCCKLGEMDTASLAQGFNCSENEVKILIPVVGTAVVICFRSGLAGLVVAGGTLGLRFINLSVLKWFPLSEAKCVNRNSDKLNKYLCQRKDA